MILPALPAHSRLWLVALESPPDPAGAAQLRQGLDDILARWRHKGQVYQAQGTLLEPQLLAVAEPNLTSQPSGCAIDGMLRKLHHLLEQLHLRPADPASSLVARLGDGLRAIPKTEIQERLDDGTLSGATPVLDLSLYDLGELRAGRLEAPLASTWVGRKFRVTVDA